MGIYNFKQKTADELRISDWSSDVCSSDLRRGPGRGMMGFAALYPSYGLRGRPPIHRRMGRAKGETHRFARRGPGRGMMGFAALYPSYGLDRKSTRLNSSH